MKPLSDYSFVRGVCHGPSPRKSHETLENELTLARRLQLNATRFWMSEDAWRADPEGYLTVGHEQVKHCVSSNDLVDVISFHDYLSTRKEIEAAVVAAEAFGAKYGKPILNTETVWRNPQVDVPALSGREAATVSGLP